MFPLPLQLFRPFSLENSQWHPVRFASWFICHISFISLNSLYLSSGPMHLSCAPQQCLQARSKHILHVTLQLQTCIFHLGCVVWMKNLLSSVVNFYLLTLTKFLALLVSGVATSHAGFPCNLPCSLLLFFLNVSKTAREASLWPGKALLLRMSDWHN